MNTAEHSPPNPSAPHGALKPDFSPVGLPFFSPQGHSQGSLSLSSLSRSARRRASGCALVAVLALGLSVQGAPAAPSLELAPSTTAKATRSAAASSARRAAFASAPRFQLMPRAGQKLAPRFPSALAALQMAQGFGREMARLGAQSNRPTQTARVQSVATHRAAPRLQSAKFTTSTLGGGKMIRLAPTAPVVAPAVAPIFAAPRPSLRAISAPLSASALLPMPLAALPPAPTKPAVPNLGGMKKVIDASSLTLPPLSKPLPSWMQNAAVKIDRIEKVAPRLAQNPGAAPIRNPAAPVTNSDRLANQIEVAASTFVVLLTTTDLQTVAVADPGIADVAVVNSRSVLLNGKSAGVTSLVIVDGQKIRQYTVRVTPSPGSRPLDIAGAIGIPGVTVRPLKDALVLEGEVANAEEARHATEIAGVYAAKVINQLSIRGQVSQEAGNAAQLRDLINLPGVNVRVSGETAILTGTVDTPQQIQDADMIARSAAKNVINQLRLPNLTVEQVRDSLGALAVVPVGSSIAGPSAPGVFNTPSPLIIREAGGSLVVEGSVSSQAQLDQILGLASRTGLPILNRVQAPVALTSDQGALAAIAQAIGRPGVRVSGSAKRLVLEGIVDNTEEAVAVEQIARAYGAQVDNLLQTPNPRLVDVDVSIVEINKNGLKNLGFNFPSLLDSSNSGFVLGQRSNNFDLPGPLTPVAPTANSIRGALTQQSAFQAALRAEVTNENVRLLSNPRTTVLSGRTATFQVGGQVPVPVSITQSATGTITGISFKDFGVLIDVVPNASANGSVTMRVKTEISQPDPTIGFTPFAGASIIPGFRRRAATTEVTTSPGGTIALGGLISNDTRSLVRKVPILGSLPVLGSLFTSKRFINNQTELVIFVTPRVLANPLPPGTTAAAGVVAVGNTTNTGTILGNPGLATGGISGNFGAVLAP